MSAKCLQLFLMILLLVTGLLTTRQGRQREVGVENEHGIGVKGF